MDAPSKVIESLFEQTENYGKAAYELAKLKSLQQTTRIAPLLVAKLCVVVMVIFFSLIANMGIALWLGDLLGKSYWGFFVVAGFYLLLAIIFNFFLHGWIKKSVSNLIITQVYQ